MYIVLLKANISNFKSEEKHLMEFIKKMYEEIFLF